MDNRTDHFKEGLLLTAIVCPFLFWLSRYINLDFWYDEVFTLKNFIFVSIPKTATDYSFPNNHIFFNLINNMYLKSIGVDNLYSLMDWPWRIRLLPLAYTLFTLAYLYLIGIKFFNNFIAKMSLILLVSTVPFYNFALQVRGYGLSTLLLCMLLYHLWSFEERLRICDAILVVLSAALSLYTIPLNLYALMGIMAIYLLLGAGKWRFRLGSERSETAADESEGIAPRQNFYGEHRHFVIVLLIGIGIVLAFLLYLPVIDQVLHNRFVESHGLFHVPILLEILPKVAYYFMSGRYLIILAFILGCFAYVVYSGEREPRIIRKAVCCSIILLLPFLFSFVRGDRPFLRVFVNLVPVFALLMSVGIYFLQSSIPVLRRRALLITIIAIIYCNVAFAAAIRNIERRIQSDLEMGNQSQDIYYNYYQTHYHPLKLARDISEHDEIGPEPWEGLFLYHYDQAAMPNYLRKFAIGFTADRGRLESLLKTRKQVYVITALPTEFESMVADKYPDVERGIAATKTEKSWNTKHTNNNRITRIKQKMKPRGSRGKKGTRGEQDL
jgi:hypothetical protein